MSGEAGKGDALRPVDRAKYEANYDGIRWRSRADGLACPKCGGRQLAVQYTRHRGGGIRRVRKCEHCGRQVPTIERMAGASA